MQHILITGGNTGIGKATALALAKKGHKIILACRNEMKAKQAVDNLKKETNNQEIYALACDLASFESVRNCATNYRKQFGQLDILINNAGITRDNLMLRMTEEQWDEVMHTNLKSVFNLTKHILRPMLKKRSGSIINMSSVVGVFGNAGQANYAASKAGIFGFTKSIAKEIGSRNIRCNAIAPGFIATEMTDELDEKTKEAFLAGIPLKRWGTPEEVANTCLFLASDLSKYVSGQTISVCGALNC